MSNPTLEIRILNELAQKLEEDLNGDENFKEIWEDWDGDEVRRGMESVLTKLQWVRDRLAAEAQGVDASK